MKECRRLQKANMAKGYAKLVPMEIEMDKSPKLQEQQKRELLPLYKLFCFADTTDKILMIIGSLSALANGFSEPLMTVVFGELIDVFGKTKDNSHTGNVVSKEYCTVLVAVKFVYLAVGVVVAASLQVICWMATGKRQTTRIRSLYLRSLLYQDVAYLDNETCIGEIVGRMSGDAVRIHDAMGEKAGKFVQLISTVIGSFVIAFIKGWQLSLVMLSVIPLVAAANGIMSSVLSQTAARAQASHGRAATVLQQTLGAIRTVASFAGEKQATETYNKAVGDAYETSVGEGLATGFGAGASFAAVSASYTLAIWFSARMIIERWYTGGTVINVILAVLAGSSALGQMSPCLAAFSSGQVAAYKMFETINRQPDIDASDMSGKVLERIHGEVELRDVYFSYPARPNELVFKGFSLLIPSGSTVAMVGKSGCGKSTVISLIERFYDPQHGQVLIDGVNLKDLQLKWMRSKIGLVSQEPNLLGSTIRDNIVYGKDGATDQDIRAAVELANAAEFINKLPQGLDTLVGEHGSQLSGGEKQRVALARAILKDPIILLLDEATSALDAKSERVLQDALDRLMVNRTTLVIAHRLSTVRNADSIYVIHQGEVIEKGTHSELVNDPNGVYSLLWRSQEIGTEQLITSSLKNSSLINGIKFQEDSFSNSSQPNDAGLLLPMERNDQPKLSNFRRLASLSKPETPVLLLGTFIAIINGCILPLFGILISSVIKVFFEPPHQLRQDTKFFALMFLSLGFVSLMANPGQTYLFAVAGSKLIQRIRSMCFEKVVHMEISWFDDPANSSGAIGARLSSDAAALRGLVGDPLGLIVKNSATLMAGLAIAFVANWELSLIILTLIPLIGLNGFVQTAFMKGLGAEANKDYEDASQVASEAVGNIKTVASFCAEEEVLKLYKLKCEGTKSKGGNYKLEIIIGVGFGMSNAMLYCAYALSAYAGAQFVEHGRAAFSDVFQVFFALAMAAIGISQSSSLVPDTSKAKEAATSIFTILDLNSKIDPRNKSGITLKEVNGDVEFKDVSFKYPTRPEIQIFRHINITIPAGKTVGLVGESGSGKSTIISLLQRLYDHDSGRITLDGVEIQTLNLKWLRDQMGLVSQEPVLFNNTIRSNIAYGKAGNATESEIIAAAKLANAHTFISSLQQGYDTIVGEGGNQLSGGQKQRVAIARAIVRNPRILLMDEATSALDVESEGVVQDALDRIMVTRTTIVVAHRLVTIKAADHIGIVKNGVIAEQGTHESLIHIKGGIYASLVALQMSASS